MEKLLKICKDILSFFEYIFRIIVGSVIVHIISLVVPSWNINKTDEEAIKERFSINFDEEAEVVVVNIFGSKRYFDLENELHCDHFKPEESNQLKKAKELFSGRGKEIIILDEIKKEKEYKKTWDYYFTLCKDKPGQTIPTKLGIINDYVTDSERVLDSSTRNAYRATITPESRRKAIAEKDL